jgi:hypothetical protein
VARPGRTKALTLSTRDAIFKTFYLFFPIPTVVRGSVSMRSLHLRDPLRSVSSLKRIPRNPPNVAPARVSLIELTDYLVTALSSLKARDPFASDFSKPSLRLNEIIIAQQSDSVCPCCAANVSYAASRCAGTHSCQDDRQTVARSCINHCC